MTNPAFKFAGPALAIEIERFLNGWVVFFVLTLIFNELSLAAVVMPAAFSSLARYKTCRLMDGRIKIDRHAEILREFSMQVEAQLATLSTDLWLGEQDGHQDACAEERFPQG